MAISLRSFRAAWKALLSQGHTNQPKATGEAGALQSSLRHQQIVEESNRLERISGVGPANNHKRGGLTLLLRPATGAIDLVELNCSCGTSQSYTRDEFEMYLGGAGRQAVCGQCKRVWNFAKETTICLVPVEGAPAEDALKPYEAFFQLAAEHGADITPQDYAKGPDGNYWLHITKTRNALSLLNAAPSSLHHEETGPIVLPTDGPEPKVEYETFDPGKGSAGFGSLAQRDYAALPRSWVEKRVRAQIRQERAYGKTTKDDPLEAEVRAQMKEFDEEVRARMEAHTERRDVEGSKAE